MRRYFGMYFLQHTISFCVITAGPRSEEPGKVAAAG